MFGIKSFLAGMTLGGVAGLFAMQFHLVRTGEGMIVVARDHQPPFKSVYVDVRKWSPTMWAYYPEVSAALLKAGRSDLLVEGAVNSMLPDQAAVENVSGQTERTETVSEKTRQAIDALIPIRFTNASDEIPLNPRTTQPPAPSRPVDGDRTVPPPQQTLTTVPAAKGWPQMETPASSLPSAAGDAKIPAQPVSVETQESVKPAGSDWMRGFLRSLIPTPSETTTSSRPAVGQSLTQATPVSSPPTTTIPPEASNPAPASTIPDPGEILPAWDQWGIIPGQFGEAIPSRIP